MDFDQIRKKRRLYFYGMNKAARAYPDYAYGEDLAGTTNTNEAAYTAVKSISVNTAFNTSYLVFHSVQGSYNLVGSDWNSRGDFNGILAGGSQNVTNESAPTDKATPGGLFVGTGIGGATEVKVSGRRNGASGTLTLTKARVGVLKMGANDYSSFVETARFTNTLMETKATLTIPNGATGKYYILVSGSAGEDASGRCSIQVTYDATTVGEYRMASQGNTRHLGSFLFLIEINDVTGGKTINLQARSTTGTEVAILNTTMVALQASRFAESQYARVAVDSAGIDTTYTQALGLTFTPATSANFLTFYGVFSQHGATTSSHYVQCTDGGTEIVEQIHELDNTNSVVATISTSVAPYAASSRTLAVNRKAEASTTTVLAGSAILTLSLHGLSA